MPRKKTWWMSEARRAVLRSHVPQMAHESPVSEQARAIVAKASPVSVQARAEVATTSPVCVQARAIVVTASPVSVQARAIQATSPVSVQASASPGCVQAISLGALIHKCQAAGYGESCTTVNTCIADSHQICDPTTQQCVCDTGYVVNANRSGCDAGLGTACSSIFPCANVITMECGSVCSCRSSYYPYNGMCAPKKLLGESCTDPAAAGTNTCLADYSACSLNGTGFFCQCFNDYHNNNAGQCTKVTYGGTCDNNLQCTTLSAICSGSPKTCICDVNYMHDQGSNSCQNHCAGINCLNGGTCSGGTCSCVVGYSGTYCGNAATLGGSCSPSGSCVDMNSSCQNGICQCKTGFYDSNNNIAGGTCYSKVALGETCPQQDACSVTNAICSSGKCVCNSNTYDSDGTNNIGGTCVAKVALGDTCLQQDACSVTNAICSSGKCVCNSNTYDSDGTNNIGGTCVAKVALGDTCPQQDACSVTNAVCYSGKCVCNSNTYDSDGTNNIGGTCVAKVALGDTCPQQDACSVTNAICSSGKCVCNSNTYDSDGTNNIGGTCVTKVALGDTCPQQDACSVTNAICSSGKCVCNSNTYDSDGTINIGGTCVAKVALGDTCPQQDACSVTNAICSSGKCVCNSNTYDSDGTNNIGGTCVAKVALGDTCLQQDACSVTNAICSSGKCVCNSNTYDSDGTNNIGGTCITKVALGDTCPQQDACSVSNAICSSGKCVCNSNTYDSDGTNNIGGTCVAKIKLNQYGCSTSVGDSCIDPKATCSAGRYCLCNNGYYDSNGATEGGSCLASIALGSACNGTTSECTDPAATCLDNKCTCDQQHYDSNGQGNGGNCLDINDLVVKSISFQSIQTTGFTVSWIRPTSVNYINYFTVSWTPKTKNNSITEGGSQSLQSSESSYIVTTGVTPGKAYLITVTSVNTETDLKNTRSTSRQAQQAAKPGQPGFISMSTADLDASDNYIFVRWSAPDSGFVSMYNGRLLDGEVEKTTFKNIQDTSTFVYLMNMRNGYRYNLDVQANSEAFDVDRYTLGDWKRFPIKTTVKVPDPPTSVECQDHEDRAVMLAWSAPSLPNGDIVRYHIQVRYDSNKVADVSTIGNETKYQVPNLNPGTTYSFRVYVENELYKSTLYGESSGSDVECKTKAAMSTPPTNLIIESTTSRGFTVKWEKPVNLFSEENYGYVLQIRNDQNVCVKEAIYRCSDCRGWSGFQAVAGLCSPDVRDPIASKTKIELSTQQTYTAKLDPDILYTVYVSATNDEGLGHKANKSEKTLEEIPSRPYHVDVTNITSTSFIVDWIIDGPRPGATNFSLTIRAESPASPKEVFVTGFTNTTVNITGLEEYWNYNVTVKASTSKGANISDTTKNYRTLPAAPGVVTDFNPDPHPNDDYTKMRISWNPPTIFDQNGIITEYRLVHNATDMTEPQKNIYISLASASKHEKVFSVKPELYYSFEVYAVNEQNLTGRKLSKIVLAPAGAPINIEITQNISVMTKSRVIAEQTNKFTITLVLEFFEQSTNGEIKATGLIACAKDCESIAVPTMTEFDTMDNWHTASKQGYTRYRVTDNQWLQKAKAEQTSNGRRKRAMTELHFTVGSESCNGQESTYCNGPLTPSTTFIVIAVTCTSGACTLSNPYTFVTAKVPDEGVNAALIGGVVGGVGGALIVIAIVALILWRRKKALPAMKKSKEDNEQGFDNMASETAKIKRKRPIQLDGIAEYVDNMHKDSNLLFSSEYDDVKTLSAKHACEAAEREENRLKNRYINIIPFDHSRVKLTTNGEDESSDYINANYLPGYSSPREYIGCQGPIPGTIDDFWRMVWEQNAAVIVMLTLCKEGQKIKCEQYWPDEVGEPKQYGEVIVEITSYSNIRTYDYRMFKITMGSKTRVIKHFHFLSWLDFQANVHHDIILDFIKQVRQHVQPPDRSGPMVIHCSAGVGRTGTYICLDHLMQFVAEHDFNVDIDIFDMVLKLRENRMHMVQTEQQYVFIHDCLKEIVERKRNEDTYVNQAFCTDDNIYQNEETLYQNVQNNQQKTEL